jgi:ribose transport system permease protein
MTTADTPPALATDLEEWVRPPLRIRLFEFLADYGFILVFLLWVAFLSLATDTFMTRNNMLILLRQASIFGIVAIGATMVMLTRELDISFGSIIGLAGSFGTSLIISGVHPVAGIAVAIGIGLVFGLVNGVIVTRGGLPSVVVTLGMLGLVEGLALLFTGGHSLVGDNLARLYFLAQGYWLGIPFPVYLLFFAYGLAYLILTRTRFGAHLYTTGDNAEAAYRAGIPVTRIKLIVFMTAGALAGFGGMILAARIGRANATMGAEALFPVLTAVILGGVSLEGGKGRVLNTLIAAIFLASIVNGLILLGVPAAIQRVVQGFVLLLAVSLDRLKA